jgi:hypothetical protein
MKKIIWVVTGIVVVAGVVLIGREKVQRPQETDSAESSVSQASHLSGGDESRRAGGGSAQGLQDAGGTEGQTEESALQELSSPVKALLGLDGKKHNYPSLLSAINELGDDISATDLAALMEMLNFPNDRFPEKMRPIEINAVKNDVLDKLLRQKQLPEGLGLQMVEMAGNADHDPVWRDYCIQFMTPFYERASEILDLTTEGTEEHGGGISVGSGSSSAAGGELNIVREAMFSALDERSETLAGTALIGLELLSRTHDEFDREVIVEKATEIASDEMASPASRMTALRLAAGLTTREAGLAQSDGSETAKGTENTEGSRNTNYDETVEAARSLAQTGETVLLRSAAIVTLGEIGTGADRELLVSYTTDSNQQIADAAKMALEKMDQEPAVESGETVVVSKTISEPQITEKLPPVLINKY